LSIRGTLHFHRIISQRLPEGEALDQQGLVPGTVIELGPETRKFLKEAIRDAFVEAVKLLDYGDYIVTFERNGKL